MAYNQSHRAVAPSTCMPPTDSSTDALSVGRLDVSGPPPVNAVRVWVRLVDGAYTVDGVANGPIRITGGRPHNIMYTHTAEAGELALSVTPDGTHGGGVAWTDVAHVPLGWSDNQRMVQLHGSVPQPLYYYSTVSAGAGGEVVVVAG